MAVKFNNVKGELENAPLTPDEIKAINDVEKYIDNTILRVFDNSEVCIELSIVSFDWSPITRSGEYNLKNARKKLMRKELERRYTEAGWKFKVRIDDGLDGPNMGRPDYWVLTGK